MKECFSLSFTIMTKASLSLFLSFVVVVDDKTIIILAECKNSKRERE